MATILKDVSFNEHILGDISKWMESNASSETTAEETPAGEPQQTQEENPD